MASTRAWLIGIALVGMSAVWAARMISVPRYNIVDLGTLGGRSTVIRSVNASGIAVGSSQTAGGAWQAFAWFDGNTRALGELLEPGMSSEAMDVNEAGKIVGFVRLADGSAFGVLWDGPRAVRLGSLGGKETVAQAINSSGQIVGWSRLKSGERRAFLWSAGQMTELNMLPASPAPTAGASGGIGDSVQARESANTSTSSRGGLGTSVAGGRAQAQGAASIGAAAQGRGTAVAETSARFESMAYDINDKGEVVGACQDPTGRWHAVIWRSGKPSVVSPAGTAAGQGGRQRTAASQDRTVRTAAQAEGGRASASGSASVRGSASSSGSQVGSVQSSQARAAAMSISANGEVVGWYEAPGGVVHAFLYSNGKSVDISPPEAIRSEALGINTHSVIVGSALVPAGGAQRAFGLVWFQRSAHILNELLVEQASIGSGVVSAVAVSDTGLIAANMINPDGTQRGVILKPYAGR